MKNTWKPFLLIGMIGIFTSGSQFAAKYIEAMWGDKDIWWTPMSLALPLSDTAQEFKIFVSGEPLQNHIQRGTLNATDKTGRPYRIVADDVKVRLNNWNKTRASRFHHAVYLALMLGSSVTFFAIGIAQLISQRRQVNQE